MLSVTTARRLRACGLSWAPSSGDRFVVADRDMDEQVFVVSEMVVEHRQDDGRDLLHFNGTTEWALDQVDVEQVLWLPREEQLRAALADRFVALARVGERWAVTTTDGRVAEHEDAEEAYAAAWLADPQPPRHSH